ncbi:TIGR01244 family sulfur transferase [Kordiimonas pumila]|uniref:TIGR01244 family sulfur transferase n=1 Tax=Kordiimonas pumila TaxID=2161677 RepID=A0ABV7D035_9PROT|nr:TIGR01244 family sulfur transferase [Kordiimonas pumila]
MTDFRAVTETLFVAPQITQSDIDRAAEEGFTLIINNRPNGEEAGQPTNDTLQAYAEAKGLRWLHIPIISGQLTMDAIINTSTALADSGKTLAFCRSGTRSCTLWGLSEAKSSDRNISDIVAKAADAGYDLGGMVPTLEHLRASAE